MSVERGPSSGSVKFSDILVLIGSIVAAIILVTLVSLAVRTESDYAPAAAETRTALIANSVEQTPEFQNQIGTPNVSHTPADTPGDGSSTVEQSVAGTPTATRSTLIDPSPSSTSIPTPVIASNAIESATAEPSVTTPPTSIVDQIIAAEQTLRTGHLQAEIDYGEGQGPSIRLTFDLGDADDPARMHLSASYPGEESRQSVERIVIGQQAWQRDGEGDWIEAAEQEGVWGQIQGYLPRVALLDERVAFDNPEPDMLTWHDDARDADVVLRVNPETGVPIMMEVRAGATGSVLTVTYVTWNAPVVINAPEPR